MSIIGCKAPGKIEGDETLRFENLPHSTSKLEAYEHVSPPYMLEFPHCASEQTRAAVWMI